MSGNFLPATELVHQMIADLKALTEHALNYQAAIVNADSLFPLEVTLLIVLLKEHKRTQPVHGELCAEIERPKATAERLQEFALVENAGS